MRAIKTQTKYLIKADTGQWFHWTDTLAKRRDMTPSNILPVQAEPVVEKVEEVVLTSEVEEGTKDEVENEIVINKAKKNK